MENDDIEVKTLLKNWMKVEEEAMQIKKKTLGKKLFSKKSKESPVIGPIPKFKFDENSEIEEDLQIANK